MAIDSRVAHGVAGRHLEDSLEASMRVFDRMRANIAKRPYRPDTAKGARRELRAIRSPVVKYSLWWTEGEDRHDGPFLAWFGARGDADDVLVLTRFRIAPAATRSMTTQIDDVGRLTLHAVARCLQRHGTLSWEDLRPVLAEATVNFILVTAAARVMSLQQIAIPAASGIFVGDVAPEGESTMETYLVLDEDVPSRWTPVRRALRAALGSRPRYAFDPAKAWPGVIELVRSELAPFWWLKKEYDPKLDPVSAAWRGHCRAA